MSENFNKKWFNSKKDFFLYILDLLFNGIVIFGLVFLIRYYLISPFQVSGQSMCNTLNFVNGICLQQQEMGEYIIVNKLVYNIYNPKRGDIVVFNPPVNVDEYYVKRIIGLPGEKIQIKDGKVWLQKKDNRKKLQILLYISFYII